MEGYVRERWEQEIVPLLCDYVRIPAKSPAFDPAWAEHGHLDAAAELLAAWARTRPVAGLTVELVRLPGRTPLLLCEIPPSRPGLGTVLLYGH